MANATKYFKLPFAENGSKADVPNESNSNNVNYDEGFTSDYELPQGDANRKTIPRTGTNQLYNDITKNLKQWQEQNYPTWIEENGDGDFYSYDKNIIVFYNGSAWISLQDSNQDEPSVTSSKWLTYEPVAKSTNDAALQTLTDDVSGLTSDISGFDDAITDNADAINIITPAVNSNTSNIATNASNIASNTAAIAAKIAPNMIKESQCVVPAADGSALPEVGTTMTFSGGDTYLSHSWVLRTTSGTADITRDTLGNVVLSNFGVATDARIYVDVPIDKINEDGSGLVAKAVYIDDNGDFQSLPSQFAPLSDVKVRLFINLGTSSSSSPTGKVFAISVSQEEGNIEILAEQTIIDNVLGGNGDVRNYEVILEQGAYSSGTITAPRPWTDYSSVVMIPLTSTSLPSHAAASAIAPKELIEVYPTSWAIASQNEANQGSIVSATGDSTATIVRTGNNGVSMVYGYIKQGEE